MNKSSGFQRLILYFAVFIFIYGCKNNNEEINSAVKSINSTEESYRGSDNNSFDFLPTSNTNQIVKHDGYTLSYSEENEQAEWVAYELKKSELNYNNNNFERPFFIEDPKVRTGSADWKNYRRSGYDKGHLCPAGDRKFSKTAFDETFYTSNISPQLHDFNDGIWNRLEQKVRYWAGKYDGIYVVTGGVLSKNLETIGDENVTVPDYFYKVLLDNQNGKYRMIAFLVPNEDSEKPLYAFVVSVDEIEKMTGIDFYPKLDDKIESVLEKNSDYKNWSFN
jgi:endonuclease G, mitochondrial